MSATGSLQVHVYTSNAQLPLKNAAIVVTSKDRTAIAMRLTDRSGLIEPIAIPVPPLEESQEPTTDAVPFALVNLYAHCNGYETVLSENIQIFANTETFQDLEMIPLPEYNTHPESTLRYNTPPQDL